MIDEVALENVSFSRRNQRTGAISPILVDASLSCPRGYVTAMFGANGSGKSTVAKLLAGILTPSKGERKVRSDEMPGNVERPIIALISQDFRATNMPWLSVVDNILLPVRLRARRQVPQKVALAKTRELLDLLLPELSGDELIGRLSGGQQQLVSLIRAIVSQPDILIADEALSALDIARSLRAVDAIRSATGSLLPPTLWISHNLDEGIALADRIVILSGKSKSIRVISDASSGLNGAKNALQATNRLRAELLEFLLDETNSL